MEGAAAAETEATPGLGKGPGDHVTKRATTPVMDALTAMRCSTSSRRICPEMAIWPIKQSAVVKFHGPNVRKLRGTRAGFLSHRARSHPGRANDLLGSEHRSDDQRLDKSPLHDSLLLATRK